LTAAPPARLRCFEVADATLAIVVREGLPPDARAEAAHVSVVDPVLPDTSNCSICPPAASSGVLNNLEFRYLEGRSLSPPSTQVARASPRSRGDYLFNQYQPPGRSTAAVGLTQVMLRVTGDQRRTCDHSRLSFLARRSL
jgi:hypothetical protein